MRSAVAVMIFATMLGAPVWADDVVDQIEEGKKLYEKGQYGEAMKRLRFAINDIRAKASERFAASMPPAPAGWTAEEVETQEMGILGGGQVLTRKYREVGGGGFLKAQLVVDNPMIQSVALVLNNPGFLGGLWQRKRVKVKEEYGLLGWTPSRRSRELSVLLGGGRLILDVIGRGVDERFLIRFMESWDFEAVKKIAGL